MPVRKAQRGPTSELGSTADPTQVSGTQPYSWSSFVGDDLEQAPPLMWPESIKTYHSMRNDAQIQGLYLGSTLPIRRYRWHIEPNGAADNVVQQVADDLGLPIKGKEDQTKGRSKRRFSFPNHLRHALLAMIYGHMYFEQVGEIKDDELWHMRKLAVRMPQTLEAFDIAPNGSLQKIQQAASYNLLGGPRGQGLGNSIEIPIDRLVAYVWDQEGANWVGRSGLRAVYRNWLLKDRTLRVAAINIERAGGVPYIKAPKDADAAQMTDLAKMARQFRVGESAGGAIPYDSELKLASAAGSEAVDYIKLQNEEMSRGWLMMFLNLGQAQTGSYALGQSFIDWFSTAQETVADWFVDTFNEHVIEDLVDWNWGEDEPAPLLGYNRNDDRNLAVKDLVEMVDKGVITMDDEIENWIREEYKMPVRVPGSERTLPQDEPSEDTSGSEEADTEAEQTPVQASKKSPLPASHGGRPFDHGGNI